MSNPLLDTTLIKARIGLARDGNGVAMQNVPPSQQAVSTGYYNATLTNTVEIAINEVTSYLEVTALVKPIFMSWGPSDASTGQFDHVIPADTTRGFVVPTGVTAVNFIEQAVGAILCLTKF
jgi:hypothetical protein